MGELSNPSRTIHYPAPLRCPDCGVPMVGDWEHQYHPDEEE